MKRAFVFVPLLGTLLLAACQEQQAQDTTPLSLTPETVGHFCQMNLLEHEGPKGQVHLEGLPGAPLFFSQVSDLVVYLRLPEQSHKVLAIYVSDMGADQATWAAPGADNWVDAKSAFFVVGAAVQGGMGAPEIVPFAEPERAQAFADQRGGSVMSLDQIPETAVAPPVSGVLTTDEDYARRLKALHHMPEG